MPTDTFTIDQLRYRLDACDTGCSCHLSPPCAFCVSLTEEEVSAYEWGGVDDVRGLRAEALAAAEDAATPIPFDDDAMSRCLVFHGGVLLRDLATPTEPAPDTTVNCYVDMLVAPSAMDAVDHVMPLDDVEMDYAPPAALSLTFAGEAQDLAAEILAHVPPGVTVWIDGRDYAIGAVDGTILRCRVVGADGIATDEAVDLFLDDVSRIHVY